MEYSGKNLVDGVLPDWHIPDICYKQWCLSMNRELSGPDSLLSPWHPYQMERNRRTCEATQLLIEDFKILDSVTCAYLVGNYVPILRNLNAARQHASPELEELLSEFKGIVYDAYKKYNGASVEEAISSYGPMGSSLRIQ